MIQLKSYLTYQLLPCLVFVAGSLYGQAPDQKDGSSIQWANASSITGIKFTLLGDVVADPWEPGGQVGAGLRETLKWTAEFDFSNDGLALKELVEMKTGQSGAALLVGDFAEMNDAPPPAQLPPGYSKTTSDKLVRAALLRFPVEQGRESQYPVYLVNADPDNRVKVTAGSLVYDLAYAVPKSFKAPVRENVKIKVSALGLEREMSFSLEPYNRGAIIAFYRPTGAEMTTFVFVNLRSLESIKELIDTQSRSDTED
jgi:hypothetical protein